jgi:large subunit ribosomal protein L25
MAQVELNVEIREASGKGVARKLRAEGKLPAVVYGKNLDAQAITVEPKDLDKALSGDAGWNTLITLKGAPAIDGKVVVLKDADFHPLRREMISADFHAINLQQKAIFMVPVNVVGTSAGQKMGGSLQLIRKELEVFCLPTEVPQSIDINVEALEIGDTVHIEEVTAPETVELAHDVNFTVITVVGHKEEEVEETEEGAEVEEAAVSEDEETTE